VNIIITAGYDTNFSVGFAKGLKANDLDFCVVSCDESSSRLTAAGIKNLNLRGSPDGNRSFFEKLTNLARYYVRLLILIFRHRGATVHFAGIFRNEFILLEGLFLNFYFRVLAGRYIYTVHNVLPHNREYSHFFRWIYRRIYRAPHILLVHTERVRQQLIGDFGVPAGKIQLTSIGLNEEIPVTNISRMEARRRLGFGEDEQIILFFGKIDVYKGLDILLEAFDLLAFPNVRLVIAGEYRNAVYRTQIHRQLERMSRRMDIHLYEQFIPNDEAEVFFKASDVLCLPYRQIYQSGVAFLGSRFGIPLVTTDVGSLREFVGDNFGIVTRSNDAIGIADALGRFFASPGRFSRSGIIDRAQKYRWASVCREFVSLYANESSAADLSGVSQISDRGVCQSSDSRNMSDKKAMPEIRNHRL